MWIGWGFDYYGREFLEQGTFGPTLLSQNKLTPSRKSEQRARKRGVIKTFVAALLFGKRSAVSRDLLTRIDYFSPVLDWEYEQIKDNNPWFKAAYLSWNYGTIEDDYWANRNVQCAQGRNILVGNSAAATNNHAEAFAQLFACSGTQDRRIVVPLSYGGNPAYVDQVLKIGREYFGERFVPLLEFQPKEEYFATLSSCGFVFMNHVRQQGLGNIVALLCMGAKVYLNSMNPLLSWLRTRGILIFEFDPSASGGKCSAEEFLPLTVKEVQLNRERLISIWGRDVKRRKTKYVVDVLTGIST
ncbi:TDP-N-acetylfucosamine:lipid II N-acetylfucosaminyltransferase [Luteimonas arsenica]|uniref:TDP-N-acetylfucosamine:lipid II N-acetylfucosaminyltransferase n=1 Tax=Luteimonas arsenica TaxID=1586242 RepID=UPI001FB8611D|nr:TDP-N-acetylfucosamine:lipid II N-acetylfucosaminyltransferase [Luteimonas arsenica]